MRPQRLVTLLLLTFSLTACNWQEVSVSSNPATDASGKTLAARIVFLAGRDSHGPLAHEHKAGSELLASALRKQHPGFETVNIYGGWPEDDSILASADALVLYCDGGKGHLINEHLDTFDRLVNQGVGVVALHYCVEVPRDSPSSNSMLNAIGGYFETDWSVNPHWEADFTSLPKHPVTKNIRPFTMLDEWYFNMRFQPGMEGVTPLLRAIAPDHTMERSNGAHSGNYAVRKLVADRVPQVTAWAYERAGGGRGFGFTGGHFHANWENDSARQLVLNAIVWSSGKQGMPWGASE
ncbi:MAG: hypothetical protein HOC23_18470 [Halieaceae bacterium]|jgi:type 1 glutamine amidotransferase|nr:hypothetical protein [Halieaceae bacterium]